MQKLFSSGTNKKVTGKAADSGYNAMQTTPKLQVQLPNLQNLFQSNTSGTGRQVTGKAADARPQAGVQSATTAPAVALGASNSGYTAAKSTPPTPRVQSPSLQTTTQNLGTIGTSKQVTSKAADSGYTPAKKQASQQANRQTVQNVFQPSTYEAAKQSMGKAADSGITTELRRAQQQANRQTVGNLFQGTKNSVNKQSDYSLAKGTAGALQKGLQRVAEAGGNTFAFAEDAVLAPFELAFGRDLGELSDNAPLNRWAQKIREEGDAVNAYYADNIKAGGKAAELYDSFGSSLIAALPTVAAAILSGGTSTVATPASLQAQAVGALSPGLTQTVRDVVRGVTKDPQYWLSLFQMVGNNYENAISDMEQQNAIAQRNGGNAMDGNSIRTKAALQAAGSGLMNAAIEVGGGLQTLPKELRQGGNVWKALANSGIGEGKEEVFQGIVDRTSQNLVYNKGNPLISLTDPNAAFSLPAAANEFTEGFTIGSILGGGQAGVLSAAQAMQGSPITSYAEAFRRFIGMKTEGTATSELTRYQELERKYLEGSISPQEADELWELERMKGQAGISKESVDSDREELTPLKIRESSRRNDAIYSPAETVKQESDFWRVRGVEDNETDEWRTFLKNKEDTATLISKIKSGEISETIRPQVQRKHIEGTKQFDEYLNLRKERGQTPQSILTISEQEAQELVEKYSGTGIVVIQKSGENSFKILEYCNANRVVGKYYGQDEYHDTKRFCIFYSKRGTHVVPTSPQKEDYNG